jgi:integrase
MIELQRLTGMRPGEVVIIRTADVDVSGKVWVYTPSSHKTEHHGRKRRIYLGPQAQQALAPWLREDAAAFIFSPADAAAGRRAQLRLRRKSRVQPSQVCRAKRAPAKRPGDAYSVDSYRKAIAYGVDRANAASSGSGNPPLRRWHPNQLRHSAATRLRREYGLDVTRAVLGHSSPAVTEGYAELDWTKAATAMERIG